MNGFQRVALVCLLVGSVLLAGPAFGFTTVSSERGVTAVVADDQREASLGIEDNTATEDRIRPNDQVEILRLHDNGVGVGSAADIEASVVAFAGERDDGFDVSVGNENGEYPVTVECAGSDGGTGTMVFDLRAAGTATVDTTWETENQIDVNCGGGNGGGPGGNPGLQVTNVEPPESGIVDFELENTGTDFRIRSVAVDHANSAAIDGEMTIATGGETRTISNNPDWPTDGSRVGVGGGKFEILSGDSATVEIDAFDADMNGESFTVTFVDDRGSSETTETVTVDVPCNAATTDCSGTDSDVVVGDSGTANGEIDTGGDVSLGNDSKTNGELTAGGDISIGDGGKTNGEVDAGGDVSTGDGYTANDDISADGDVSLGDDSKTNGELTAGGDISIGDGGKTNREVDAGGDITTGDDYTANDDISADGDVSLGNRSTTNGEVTATGDISVGSNSKIQDDISADGDIYIGSESTVNGELDAGGDVYVEDAVKFNRDVTVSGTIRYGCDVTFNGDLDAGSEVNTC